MTNRGDKKNATGSVFRRRVAGWIALHDRHNTDIGTGLCLQLFHSLDAKFEFLAMPMPTSVIKGRSMSWLDLQSAKREWIRITLIMWSLSFSLLMGKETTNHVWKQNAQNRCVESGIRDTFCDTDSWSTKGPRTYNDSTRISSIPSN